MKKEKRNQIAKSFEKLKKEDTFSLVLFILANLKNVDEYKVISELSFVLDEKNLTNFLNYFEGMTIKIPTIKEFRLVYNALYIYELVNLENYTIDNALEYLNITDKQDRNDIRKCYSLIDKTLQEYNFNK